MSQLLLLQLQQLMKWKVCFLQQFPNRTLKPALTRTSCGYKNCSPKRHPLIHPVWHRRQTKGLCPGLTSGREAARLQFSRVLISLKEAVIIKNQSGSDESEEFYTRLMTWWLTARSRVSIQSPHGLQISVLWNHKHSADFTEISYEPCLSICAFITCSCHAGVIITVGFWRLITQKCLKKSFKVIKQAMPSTEPTNYAVIDVQSLSCVFHPE